MQASNLMSSLFLILRPDAIRAWRDTFGGSKVEKK